MSLFKRMFGLLVLAFYGCTPTDAIVQPSGGTNDGGQPPVSSGGDAGGQPPVSSGGDAGGQPSSGDWHLWVVDAVRGQLLGYATHQLTTGNAEAEIKLSGKIGCVTFQFSSSGDLYCWVGQAINKFAAKDLEQSGLIEPVGTFIMGTTDTSAVALDPQGDVWTAAQSGYGTGRYHRYPAAQFESAPPVGKQVTPDFNIGLDGAGLEFDPQGNLYTGIIERTMVATLIRFDAAQLGGADLLVPPGKPALRIEPGHGYAVYPVTFWSGSGQLVFLSDAAFRYSKEQLAMSDNPTSPPEATISVAGARGLLNGTYDPEGRLWLADKTKIYRVERADLARTGIISATPGVTLTAPSTVTFGAMRAH